MTTTETTASQPKDFRKVLVEVRESLQFANDSPNGGIDDTIWMMHSSAPETVFDFIDAALDGEPSTPQKTADLFASQPKSIGDDVKLENLLSEYASAVNRATSLDRETFLREEIIRLFHSSAPADQASATIQAAPEVMSPERVTEIWSKVADEFQLALRNAIDPADAGNLTVHFARAVERYVRSAATIQEPVMVAEPVGEKFSRVGFSVATGSARIIVATAITQEWADRIVSALAAPMVADPAGVATKVQLWWRTDMAEWRECMGDEPEAVEFSGIVPSGYRGTSGGYATTVKAVPSEALEVVASGYEGGTMISDPTGLGATISMHYASTAEAENAFDSLTRFIDGINFAAPLADKTGGGE